MMDFFFKPKGVAIVGASANAQKGGYSILKNLKMGFEGEIYPVNPRYREIEGLTCYSSVLEVPDPVDLAIIFIAAPLVPGAIRECAERGIQGAMIESGGFAETGADGRSLQDALKRIVSTTGIRLWGPNCMGLVDTANGSVFSFSILSRSPTDGSFWKSAVVLKSPSWSSRGQRVPMARGPH